MDCFFVGDWNISMQKGPGANTGSHVTLGNSSSTYLSFKGRPFI
jgi:hypothetical protein